MTRREFPEAAELYRQGLSAAEIGRRLGTTGPTILTRLREAGVELEERRGGDRWSGRYRAPQAGSYAGQHHRVRAARGAPSECSQCGTTEDRRYEWANLTGDYDDIKDYARMCVPCHRNYDNARRLRDGN